MKIETVRVDSLSLDPANARKHGVKNLASIKGSLKKFDQQKPIVVDRNGIVVAGNGTLEAARDLGWELIDIVRTDLEGDEAKAFALADNRTSELAEWDAEILGDQLKALDAVNFDLGAIGFTKSDLDTLWKDNAETGDGDGIEYTKKIQAPIYEIKGDQPEVGDLVDTEKADHLLRRIEGSQLPDEIKEFLAQAALRHNVFNYELIAEFYAHAPKELQELMEESALVIIDFNKAIESGFVVLSEKLAEAYPE